jgi:hypothetical protein
MLLSIRQLKMLLFCDALLNRLEWYIEKGKGWIPAFAEEHHSEAPPHNAPRMGIKCSGGKDRLKARSETDWYAACSGETHQRWIGEGGHPFQV